MEKLHKDSKEAPNKVDVVRWLRFLYESNDILDNEIDELFQLGGALFILAAQYIVARTVIRSPEAYAEIVQTDNGSDADFKREGTIKGMVEFISDECCRSKKPMKRSSEERLRMLNVFDDMLEDSGASSPSPSSSKPRSLDSGISAPPSPLDDIVSRTTGDVNRSRNRLAFTPSPEESSSSSSSPSSSDSETSGDFAKAPAKSPAKPSKNAAKDSHSKTDKASARTPAKSSETQNKDSPSKGKSSKKETNDSPSKKTKASSPSLAKLFKTKTLTAPLTRQSEPVQASPRKTKQMRTC
ncbi:hypothetical protein OS493_019930 [Desmophyllum pertusum]|uniref:Uncharacterized protein n=1 Tax=Desmophyllum pertusum TaxID=174260 RepID=A0A9X0CJP5_9CNID|nr:hypothetical protein OS493_019930 [Desmophyllum pertusum]